MEIRAFANGGHFDVSTRILLGRMLSPLCGLDQMIGFLMRAEGEPTFCVAGADLTGVHTLRQQPKPKQGSYHIGGTGLTLEEVFIRSLGESVERYGQLVSEVARRSDIVYRTYDEMSAANERVVDPDKLNLFRKEQFEQPRFPFSPLRRDSLLGWVQTVSLLDDGVIWVPAQMVLVGYTIKGGSGEPWMNSAMTTGSAAHTAPILAARNALLELIQLDSVMGHWYSAASASEILLDQRTVAIADIIRKHFASSTLDPKFYWIPNADLPGLTVTCVLRAAPGCVPAVGVGIGIDLVLIEAMYKALIEAIGVIQLAKLTLFDERTSRPEKTISRDEIYDLDLNTAYYARPHNALLLEEKFGSCESVRASLLPADSAQDARSDVRHLVEAFRTTGKELVYLDLSTADVRDLGFTTLRVWSPDTLSLSLPGAPMKNHPRFVAYGGFYNSNPHPYP